MCNRDGKCQKKDFIQCIEAIVPNHAEINQNLNASHFEADVSWLLNDDPVRRPNKRSLPIKIRISREVVDDYQLLPVHDKNRVLENIKLYLSSKYKTFNPDVGDGNLTPPEIWVIDQGSAGMLF
jgi:hypothetical protein